MPPSILVITGPSGVGKSTVSELVARSFDSAVRISIDQVQAQIVAGHVEQSSPRAAQQNHVVGGAVVGAAMEFARGGYTAVIDGCIFPEVLPGLASACARRGIELHYAVLRAELGVCLERARGRSGTVKSAAFTALYARFGVLGSYETHHVDASPGVDGVAAAVRVAFDRGQLRVS